MYRRIFVLITILITCTFIVLVSYGKDHNLSKKTKVEVAEQNKNICPHHRSPKTGTVKNIGGMEFVYIRGGTYLMGSKKSDSYALDSEFPRHRVTVSGFWIGQYEVTNVQYLRYLRSGGDPDGIDLGDDDCPLSCSGSSYKLSGNKFGSSNNQPILVTWHGARDFCRWFSVKYGVKARLPYEAEWEYACRAGTTTRYYWGNSINVLYCWYDGNSGDKTHPVGKKVPNRWGLYDISGNAGEWCMDRFDSNYYSNSLQCNPHGPSTGAGRTIRGGSYLLYADSVRSADRLKGNPVYVDGGFRVVLSSRLKVRSDVNYK